MYLQDILPVCQHQHIYKCQYHNRIIPLVDNKCADCYKCHVYFDSYPKAFKVLRDVFIASGDYRKNAFVKPAG